MSQTDPSINLNRRQADIINDIKRRTGKSEEQIVEDAVDLLFALQTE